MSSNEKLMLKDEELDMISGGETWICERVDIGSYPGVSFVSKTYYPDTGYSLILRHSGGLEDAKDFMDQHKGDIFQTADGKAFTL